MAEIIRSLKPAVAAEVRSGVARAMAWREFGRQVRHVPPMHAVRARADDVWVQAQIAKRESYIRRIAEEHGLDPTEATRRWRQGTFTLPGSAVR